MEVIIEAGVVRKVAHAREESRRLAAEAALLAEAAHPGVVRVIRTTGGDPPWELVLAEVPGQRLADMGRELDWSEIAGLGAALATTLADLHDIGIAHRSLSSDHILLDEEGRPVLCGFGNSLRCQGAAEVRTSAADDTRLLATLLRQLGDGTPPRSVARALRTCTNRRQLARGSPARRLARALVDSVPSARLPGTDSTRSGCVADGRQAGGRHRKVTRLALAMVTASAAAGVLLVARGAGGGGHGSGCPAVDDGCTGREVESGSVVSTPQGRFVLTGVNGVEVVGRWGCSTSASPAVLDVARGDVWVFDGWPSDPSGVSARRVAVLPGASGLRVVPGSRAASRCDTLLVERGRLAPASLDLSRA